MLFRLEIVVAQIKQRVSSDRESMKHELKQVRPRQIDRMYGAERKTHKTLMELRYWPKFD